MTTAPAAAIPANTPSTDLKRRVRQYNRWETGLFHVLGDPPEIRLSTLLRFASAQELQRVYLIGGTSAHDAPPKPWWLEPTEAGERWRLGDYRQDAANRGGSYTYDYYGKQMGQPIQVAMLAQWFGAHADSVARGAAAINTLEGLLRGAFDQHARMLGTPARTGLDLWERSLPMSKGTHTQPGKPHSYPLLAEELRDIILHNCGQGRLEFLRLGDAPAEVSRLLIYDSVWQYAACMKHLPVGPARRWRNNTSYWDFIPGFYEITFRVPCDWRHVGILPELVRGEDGDPRTIWPNKPGTWHASWASGAEVAVALEQGWKVRISQSITWPDYQNPAYGPNPARTFTDKLRTLRERCTDPALRYAIRAMLLGAVGSCHRVARPEHHIIPAAQQASIPAGARDLEYTPSVTHAQRIAYTLDVPLHPDLQRWQRPEWSATVWGRSRARTVRKALECDPAVLGGIRTDGLVTYAPAPQLADEDAQVGDFRLKFDVTFNAARPRPMDEGAYRALVGEEIG